MEESDSNDVVGIVDKVLCERLKGNEIVYQGKRMKCQSYYMTHERVHVLCDTFTIRLDRQYSTEVLKVIVEHNNL